MRKQEAYLNKFFGQVVAILISISMAGCITVTSEKDAIKSDMGRLSEEVATLKRVLDELGKTEADATADIDLLSENVARLSGGVEEKDFELERINENIELMADTISSLDKRIKSIEEAVTAPPEGPEGTGGRVSTLPELSAAVKELEEKLASLEEGSIAAKKVTETAPPDAKTLYMEGLSLVRTHKDYLNGLENFKRFLSLYPAHELADNAQYWIGEIYYVKGDWERAVLEFNKVVKDYPKGDKVAASLLKQGFSFEQLGAVKEAKVILKKVVDKYPKSEEAEHAKKRLKKLK